MAPKSKQAARRARVQGEGKGASRGLRPQARSESDPLDKDYESGLYRQMPAEVQQDIQLVAQVLMNTYDGMPLDIAMASANRFRREQRELFDYALRDAQDADRNSGEEPPFFPWGMYEELPPHVQAEIRPVATENLRGGLSMQHAMEQAIYTVLEQHEDVVDAMLRDRGYTGSYVDENNVRQPIFTGKGKGKGKGKGFEPFSGKGRRLDDES
jgi:hypothetical protein